MLKADEKQRNQLTDEEFKKLPKPEEVIKIAHGPVIPKKEEVKLTVLQKFSQLLKTWQCSGQLPVTKEMLLIIGRQGSGLDHYANMETSALKYNSLLLESCDDKCLTSPSLWTQ